MSQTINFNVAFTTSEENVLAFASMNGYTPESLTPPSEYVCSFMKDYIAEKLNTLNAEKARSEAQQLVQTAIQQSLNSIKEDLEVSVE